jgi:Hemolysin-type calcium-binding repeat (2 copies).
MAQFEGTELSESITPFFVSPSVSATPPGSAPSDAADTADGGGGDDFLFDEGGNDALFGAAGNDYLLGGNGSDTEDGGEGNDSVDGGGDSDLLIGDAGNDRITGDLSTGYLPGNDTLLGGAGNDSLEGGAGDDSLDGGDGLDTASYLYANASVVVSLAITGPQQTGALGIDTLRGIEGLTGSFYDDTLTGDAGNNTIDGFRGNDSLAGGDGVDRLYGSFGNDTLDGGGSRDWLYGEPGNDWLTGGDGPDFFVYVKRDGCKFGNDVITDFATGVDWLRLIGYTPADVNIDDTTDTITLSDGTTIKLQNISGNFNPADILYY